MLQGCHPRITYRQTHVPSRMPSAYHHTVLGLAWLVPVTADFDMTDCLMVPLTLEDLREPLGVALGDLSSASFSLS